MRPLLLALLAITGSATFADDTPPDADFTVTVVDHLQRPVADAVVLAPTTTKDELKIFRTNADGVTKLPSLTAGNHLDHFAGLLPTRNSERWLRSGLLSKRTSTKRWRR
jgi:hypothetical protein